MRLPIEVWQGCSGYWQSAFIRENLLPLGHAAWQGYLAQGRGLVVCDVEVVEAASVDWSGDVVKYEIRYPASGGSARLPARAGLEGRLCESPDGYGADLPFLRGN